MVQTNIYKNSIDYLEEKKASLIPQYTVTTIVNLGMNYLLNKRFVKSIYSTKAIGEVFKGAIDIYKQDYYGLAEDLIKAGAYYALSQSVRSHPMLIVGSIFAEGVYDYYKAYYAYDNAIAKLELMAENNSNIDSISLV